MIMAISGMSSSGKDTVYARIIEHGVEPIVLSTTRDMRDGEVDGKAYHFRTINDYLNDTDIIYEQKYESAYGQLIYYIRRSDIEKLDNDKLYVIILPEKELTRLPVIFKGHDTVVLHIISDISKRISRYMKRCKTEDDYHEMCRRMIIDKEDHDIAIKEGLKDIIDYEYNNCDTLESLDCWTDNIMKRFARS